MALIRLGHESSLAKEGDRIYKESYDRCIVLIRAAKENDYLCVEVPDASYAQYSADKLQGVENCRKHSTYRDSDGMLWVNVTKSVKPEVDKSFRAVKYPPGADVPDCPPPLIPFAGCDRKAMAPSPAKPFSLPASPAKPSPFKERVDTATEAVMRKNWASRQQKMGDLFTAKKPAPAAAAAAAAGGMPPPAPREVAHQQPAAAAHVDA